ncbi:MAG TPA: recombinase family protein [Syntrophomonadaceae bacterium]|nr:recombinase family protein [Syntrophomonadaceae bacterium]
MEKVFGYVRVSTETQAKSGYGAAAQKHAINDYCKNNNLELVEVFEDLGITGITIEREGLTQLISSFNGVEKVIVLNTSRLWRNDTVRVLIKRQFELAGADIISIEQPSYSIKADNPNDYLFNGIMELLDQYERMNTILKLARGRKSKAKSGVKGSGETPLGYKWKHDGVDRPIVVIDEPQADVVRIMYEKYIELGSIGKVKNYLNEHKYLTKRGKPFNDMGVRNILVNDFYIGTVSWGTLETDGQHEPIIDQQLFEQVQEQIKRNTRNPGISK